MTEGTMHLVARVGRLGDYEVYLAEDTVTIIDASGIVTRERVDGLGGFVARSTDVRLGWGQFPDGMEVIYLYDQGDDNFGYAVNLHDAQCSEWGYAPFPARNGSRA